MSKFLKTLLSAMLALTLVFAFTGCDNTGDDGDDKTTGEFIYQLATGTKTENNEEVEYSYYKITGFTVTAEDNEKFINGDFSSLGSNEAEISAKRNITIPKVHEDGKPIEEIESMAFANKLMIQSVTFPEDTNIKKIGAGAFSGCTNLEAINGLPFIGESADAKNEKRVFGYLFGNSAEGELNTTVSAKIKIEDAEPTASFVVPSSLKKVTFTDGVKSVKECAFYGFNMLEEVIISGAEEVEAGAFTNCSSVISIKLPKVKAIYDSAFEGCSVLQKVDLEGNDVLTYIGDSAFSGCIRLGYNFAQDSKEALQLDLSNVTYLGTNAFKTCSTLKYVKLSAVSDVKVGAFAECAELKEVILKDASVSISACAFSDCDKDALKVIDLNGNTITLSSEAFGEANLD